jgi:hypothetical protein
VDVVLIVMASLALLLLAAAIVYGVRQRRFQDPGIDYDEMDDGADLFVNRSGGGGAV